MAPSNEEDNLELAGADLNQKSTANTSANSSNGGAAGLRGVSGGGNYRDFAQSLEQDISDIVLRQNGGGFQSDAYPSNEPVSLFLSTTSDPPC